MVVHGEPQASDALRIRIEEQLGWPARVPQAGERLRLQDLPSLRDASRR